MHRLNGVHPNAGTIGQQSHLNQSARGQGLAAPRRRVRTQAASTADLPVPEPLQSTVAYARAFMVVALRHASDAALETAASINMTLAEQPRRMQEFQQEIRAVAEREMHGSSQRLISPVSSVSGSSQASSSSSANAPVDLAALVDELRADIAASRSLLQQIRISEQRTQ